MGKIKKYQGGGRAPYKPLSKAELSALAHQYRGSDVDRYRYRMSKDNPKAKLDSRLFDKEYGELTPRETQQLKEYMNSRSTLQKAWEAAPNVFGKWGASGYPKGSRLDDDERKKRGVRGGTAWVGDNDAWERRMERKGYRKGGKISKKPSLKKVSKSKPVAKSKAKMVTKSVKKKK